MCGQIEKKGFLISTEASFEKSLFVCLSTFFSETSEWIATKLGMNIKTGLGRVLTEPNF